MVQYRTAHESLTARDNATRCTKNQTQLWMGRKEDAEIYISPLGGTGAELCLAAAICTSTWGHMSYTI